MKILLYRDSLSNLQVKHEIKQIRTKEDDRITENGYLALASISNLKRTTRPKMLKYFLENGYIMIESNKEKLTDKAILIGAKYQFEDDYDEQISWIIWPYIFLAHPLLLTYKLQKSNKAKSKIV